MMNFFISEDNDNLIDLKNTSNIILIVNYYKERDEELQQCDTQSIKL